MGMVLKLKLKRYQSGKSWYQNVEVPYEEGMTFLRAFNRIKEEIDESFSFRHFCRAGICGTCSVLINGFPKLACKEQVLPYVILGEEVLIEPLKNFAVIKDLVIDSEPVIKRIKEFHLWIKEKDQVLKIQPQISKKIEDAADCILCLACQAYCPQVLDENYAGPLFFAKFYRYALDPRDDQDRLNQAIEQSKLMYCLSCNKCNNACPKEVHPATLIRELMTFQKA